MERFFLSVLLCLLLPTISAADEDAIDEVNRAIHSAGEIGQLTPIYNAMERLAGRSDRPLSGDKSGQVLLNFYSHLIEQRQFYSRQAVLGFIRRALRLGADPMATVKISPSLDPFAGVPSNIIDVLVNELVTYNRSIDIATELRFLSAQQMLDTLFEERLVDVNYQTLWVFQSMGNRAVMRRRVGFVHLVLFRNGSATFLIKYFIRKGVGPQSLDDGMWNMAMVAAATGNIEALQIMAELLEPRQRVELFNYQSPLRFKYTPLFAALISLSSTNMTAEQTLEIIRLLASNGANPTTQNLYRSLYDEAAMWALRTSNSEKKEEFLKLASLLLMNRSDLYATSQAFCRTVFRGEE